MTGFALSNETIPVLFPLVKVTSLTEMRCAASYCYISLTGDSEVTHFILCSTEYDRPHSGLCRCATRLTGGETADEDWRGRWGYCAVPSPASNANDNIKAKGVRPLEAASQSPATASAPLIWIYLGRRPLELIF